MKANSVYLSVRVASETAVLIDRIAAAECKSRSEILRSLLEKGLAAGGYIPGLRELDEVIREVVAAQLQPAVSRLAAISAKATHIGAASFFMATYAARQSADPSERQDFDAVAARARRLGVEYLKLSKEVDLDEWLGQAYGRMQQK